MHATRGLFSAEEAFVRLGQTRETGCLVIVSEKETIRIFTRNGAVVNAYTDGKEGQPALDNAFSHVEASYVWIPQATPLEEKINISIAGYALKNAVARDVHIAKTSKVALDSIKPDVSKGGIIKPDSSKGGVPKKQVLRYYLSANDQSGKKFPIDRGTMILGREESCDIVLVHPQVSRRHCLLQLMARGLAFRDLGSTNGVFVNDFPAQDGFVQPGDKLSLGACAFVVHREP